MAKYLVLGARHYDFINKDTGERLVGVKITYVDQPEYDASNRGFTPMSISADESLWADLSKVPGLYDFDFGMKATKVGAKPTLVLRAATLVEEVQLPA